MNECVKRLCIVMTACAGNCKRITHTTEPAFRHRLWVQCGNVGVATGNLRGKQGLS